MTWCSLPLASRENHFEGAIGARTALVIDHNNYLLQKFKNLGVFDTSGIESSETVEEALTTLVKAEHLLF